ncbi:3',5'-cyclic-nucleotide phosphodiesterase [Xanthomonas massiliensis]|uniref:3',5'-cyclic-nucleotide phosphodiesterase n=1 Tax=Xanthomonas massiliensis TaxID=1720302 RepID=UPI00098FBC81|nr:3',5'-cyclic-nucleotide phosphodiesterase [Xanthomonas massiliensis]
MTAALARPLLAVLLAVAAAVANAAAPPTPAPASAPPAPAFELVALGVRGGDLDGDLSAWLVRGSGDARYLALDAGTLLNGLRVARARGAFATFATPPACRGLSADGCLLREGIAGYFVSHPHLDHVGGLLIAAPDDSAKPIYGLATTLDALSRDYFNWSAWPNFADRGAAPALGQYRLLAPGEDREFAIDGTALHARLLPLQHDRMVSSALLVRAGQDWLAYFGDTGPDAVQHSTRLAEAWKRLAPLLRSGRLRALVIETSYPDGVADERLYGHLTPHWLLAELHALARETGGEAPLRGLAVVVTHIKPSLGDGPDPRQQIGAQLQAGNDLGVRFLFPRQGDRLVF